MRFALILGIFLIGLYLFGRWSLRVGAARTAQALRWAAFGLGLMLLLILASRGGAAFVGPILFLLIPLLLRGRNLWHRQPASADADSASSASQDSRSTVESRFLRMSLNHASGEMYGIVLDGNFAGRELADLSLEELLILWQECQQDAQSLALLEAYLDSSQPEGWREQTSRRTRDEQPGFRAASMSREEAYKILGLSSVASHDEIKAAHRRLMQRVHPDHGGSTYLAAQINQAKKILIGD